MTINRFHWGISHYIGSQLRQCVLDPDGATLYSACFPKSIPRSGRRLFPPPGGAAAAPADAAAGGGGAAGGDGEKVQASASTEGSYE